jgi:hypothetical protein
MAKSPFEQVVQYVEKRQYDKARDILRTMPGNLTAQRWLKQIDEIESPSPRLEPLPLKDDISPHGQPVKVSQSTALEGVNQSVLPEEGDDKGLPEKAKRVPFADDSYETLDQEIEKARNGGRVAGGVIAIIGAGVTLFMLLANPFTQSSSRYGSYATPPSSDNYFFTALFVGLGLLFVCLGIYQIWYANQTDKIRASLLKGKARNIKRAGFMFLGMAVLHGLIGISTGQMSNLGTGVLWGIGAGFMMLYQLPKAEAFDRRMAMLQDGEKAKRGEW